MPVVGLGVAFRQSALEIGLVADDLDVQRAERYRYVNRLLADDQLHHEVDGWPPDSRALDHDAIARTKPYVDQATLSAQSELVSAAADARLLLTRPAQQAPLAGLDALCLNLDSDLGRRVVDAPSER